MLSAVAGAQAREARAASRSLSAGASPVREPAPTARITWSRLHSTPRGAARDEPSSYASGVSAGPRYLAEQQRYSARGVCSRYGSSRSAVVRSSTITPMYACERAEHRRPGSPARSPAAYGGYPAKGLGRARRRSRPAALAQRLISRRAVDLAGQEQAVRPCSPARPASGWAQSRIPPHTRREASWRWQSRNAVQHFNCTPPEAGVGAWTYTQWVANPLAPGTTDGALCRRTARSWTRWTGSSADRRRMAPLNIGARCRLARIRS
jgi:hypothetical protein